jgi:uncharacterized protein involved in exopolysaccharide biosynthesis
MRRGVKPPPPLNHLWGLLIVAGGVGLALGVLFGFGTFLSERQYQAKVRFSPESGAAGRVSGSLVDLTSQFSLSLGSQGIKPLQYYSVVLRSDVVIDRVLNSNISRSLHATTLWGYLETRFAHSDSVRREDVRRWLRNRVAVTADNRATTMELAVTLPDRDLAAAAANLFVEALNEFNSSSRASQARARREYLETALRVRFDSLRQAEDSLQRFLEHNRAYRDAPALEFRQARLRRRVDLNQQVVSSLQRDFEAARLEEINETPILSVIDSAAAPHRPVSPKRRLWAILGFALGTLGTVACAGLGYAQGSRRRGLLSQVALRVARTDRRIRQLLARRRS